MISPEALVALGALDRGARYNTVHTTAQELMKLGFACEDWGKLGITEMGRRFVRRGKYAIAITSDDQYCDLSVHNMKIPDAEIDRSPQAFWKNQMDTPDPMAAPHRAAAPVVLELLPEAPPEPLPIAESRRVEMMRAAGVASGKTGVWVEEAWVEEFIRALDGDA